MGSLAQLVLLSCCGDTGALDNVQSPVAREASPRTGRLGGGGDLGKSCRGLFTCCSVSQHPDWKLHVTKPWRQLALRGIEVGEGARDHRASKAAMVASGCRALPRVGLGHTHGPVPPGHTAPAT